MIALLLACRPDPADDSPAPASTGDTGTQTSGCTADATDGLDSEPFFVGWSGQVAFRTDTILVFSALQGAFLDKPEERFQVESAREGLCRLETYTPSPCDPACGGDQLCREGACIARPQRLEGGTLTLSGPFEEPWVIPPDALGGYYHYAYEGSDPEATLVLEGTAGADIAAFHAQTCPVRAPQATEDWVSLLEARQPGEDVVLAWSDPQPKARIRLRMTTGTATHGGIAHAEIACEGPDTGSLTLPGPFLDVLYEQGWSCGECGGNELVRYRAGQIEQSVFVAEAATSFYYIP